MKKKIMHTELKLALKRGDIKMKKKKYWVKKPTFSEGKQIKNLGN